MIGMPNYARNGKKILLVAAAFAALAVGCSPAASDDASPKHRSGKEVSKAKSENAQLMAPAVCAEPMDVEFDGRVYRGVENVAFESGSRVGTAVPVTCDDTDKKDDALLPQPKSPVSRVKGVDPRIAIAVADTFYVVNSGKKLPARVQKLIDDAAREAEGPAAACAMEVEFAGRVYAAADARRDIEVGNKVGKAVHVACNDSTDGNDDGLLPQPKSPAYEIKGVDPRIAIAVDASKDTRQVYVVVDQPLPAKVRRLISSS